MSERWFEYDFATLRLVPRVHRGECRNIGVMVHAPRQGVLAGRFVTTFDGGVAGIDAGIDTELVCRYLRGFEAILAGDARGGPIAALSTSERFHWLTAPRSDILQPSPVHHGRCRDLDACLDELFESLVR